MPTLRTHHDGVDLAYQRFGCTGDPVLLIMGFWRTWGVTGIVALVTAALTLLPSLRAVGGDAR